MEREDILGLFRRSLKHILDDAEARNYEPPADCVLVADLEFAIARLIEE